MANLPGSIKNLNTLLGEQLLDGGGSGGGGSSDFSTATMTVVGDPNVADLYFPYVSDFDGIDTIRTKVSDDAPFTIVMYKGSATLIDTNNQITSAEGDIESKGRGYYLITGDCTITIS